MKIEELVQQLIPYFNGSIPVTGGSLPIGGYTPTPHALNGAHHTGEITDAQHGVRTFANAHAHSAMSGIGASDHHVQTSITAEAGLTGGGAGAGVTLAVGAGNGIVVNADDVAVGVSGLGLSVGVGAVTLTSSSNPGAAASILASDASGYLTLVKVMTDTLADKSDGNLTISPAADLVLTPGGTARVLLTSGVRIQSDNYVSQTTGWGIGYAGGGDFRYLYADEMHAKSFIADLEQALAGGQIISKSVAPLYSDFMIPARGASASMVVKDFPGVPMRVFADGDYVRVRTMERGIATTNVCTNPSFETNTTGWATVPPAGVLNRVSTNAWVGSYSLENPSGLGGYYAGIYYTYISGAGYITWSLHVKVEAGIALKIGLATAAGNGVDVPPTWMVRPMEVAGTGNWEYYTDYEFHNAGTFYFMVVSNNVYTGRIIYIDGLQIEETDQPTAATAYCDGSMGLGYAWTGTAHASTSTRIGGSLSVLDAYGTVTFSGRDDATKSQTYTFTRPAGDTGHAGHGMTVGADAIEIDYGESGDGYYEVTTLDPMGSPYAQVVTWATHPQNITCRTRLGNLGGIFNDAQEYGLYAGDVVGAVTDANHYIRISNSHFDIHNIAVKMSAAGTESFISMGVTPPTSPTAGTGIWLDRTGLYGLLSGVTQAKFDAATGAITAGGGVITLDVNGESIALSSNWANARAYQLKAGTNFAGGLGGEYSGSDVYVYLKTGQIAGLNHGLYIQALTAAGKDAICSVIATAGGVNCGVVSRAYADSTSYVSITGDFVTIAGGLNIGTATSAGTGEVRSSGNLTILNGQSFSINKYYNPGAGSDKLINAGYAADIYQNNANGTVNIRNIASSGAADANITMINRIIVDASGNVTIVSLAGAGNRPVYADANGKLYC